MDSDFTNWFGLNKILFLGILIEAVNDEIGILLSFHLKQNF